MAPPPPNLRVRFLDDDTAVDDGSGWHLLDHPAGPTGIAAVAQHRSVAASLYASRGALLDLPGTRLHQLGRLDEQLRRHTAALARAGEAARAACEVALATAPPGDVFIATMRAIEAQDASTLDHLLSLADGGPFHAVPVRDAFTWVSAVHLRGISVALLDSRSPLRRCIGLLTCRHHAVDPAGRLDLAATDVDPELRAVALRVAGEIGRQDLLPVARRSLRDPDTTVRFEAARAAVRLGDRDAGAWALRAVAAEAGPHQHAALATWRPASALAHGGTGAGPTPRQALEVLVTGPQSLRHEAAEYLTLLAPGMPLFDVSAPAWRQQRGLVALGAVPPDLS